jgi:hypothetical protein
MNEPAAKTYDEAMELAWQKMKPVFLQVDTDGPLLCDNCKSYKQYGLTACQGCCGR